MFPEIYELFLNILCKFGIHSWFILSFSDKFCVYTGRFIVNKHFCREVVTVLEKKCELCGKRILIHRYGFINTSIVGRWINTSNTDLKRFEILHYVHKNICPEWFNFFCSSAKPKLFYNTFDEWLKYPPSIYTEEEIKSYKIK